VDGPLTTYLVGLDRDAPLAAGCEGCLPEVPLRGRPCGSPQWFDRQRLRECGSAEKYLRSSMVVLRPSLANAPTCGAATTANSRRDPRKRHQQGEGMSLEHLVESHLVWLESMQYAESTVKNRRTSLQQLVEWASAREITYAEELGVEQVEGYRTHLASRRKPGGEGLAIGSQVQRLLAVKMFCRWLKERGHIDRDLASALRFPRRPQSLPRGVLNEAEVERVLRGTATGYRDRVMLEVLYATGIRRSELVALTRDDVDGVREVLFILEGKGAKDRVVPISERALWWISA